jgi:hypothetical protein
MHPVQQTAADTRLVMQARACSPIAVSRNRSQTKSTPNWEHESATLHHVTHIGASDRRTLLPHCRRAGEILFICKLHLSCRASSANASSGRSSLENQVQTAEVLLEFVHTYILLQPVRQLMARRRRQLHRNGVIRQTPSAFHHARSGKAVVQPTLLSAAELARLRGARR